MTAALLTVLAAAPGVALLLAWCLVHRKPTMPAPCGNPACEACALLSGKWPKYNPGPRERQAMSARRQQRARPATREEIQAQKDKSRAMALIRDAGGC